MDTYGHGGDTFAYDSIRYDFSVNINPLGMPEAVKNAVGAHIEEYETYPDTKYRALRPAIAEMEQVDPGHIVCGNGAADLIYRLCLSRRPSRVLVCAPGFSEYERAALQSGALVSYHTLSRESSFTLTEEILSKIHSGIDLVFLCSPNNPTGRVVSQGLIEQVAKRAADCGALLILDECFLDFTTAQSAKPLLSSYQNLVILKAFTKIFAMAGLRLGYLICSDPHVTKQASDFGQC
jgi:threonine-phosphate decarboxylase